MTPERIDQTTILQGTVGSKALGLNIGPEDDLDQMGVCVEDMEHHVGLSEFEHYVYRSAEARDGKGARSKAGDLDLTVYSLKKYVRLALEGNPSIQLLLFVPPYLCQIRTSRGAQLQELAPHFVSRKAAGRYLGYMQSQRQRLLGQRGQKDVNRPELVEKYGFDTKYATHLLRLGLQGVELLETGRLELPMQEPFRGWLKDVRTGAVPLEECLAKADVIEANLVKLRDSSWVQEAPNRKLVEEWMLDTYLECWKSRRASISPKEKLCKEKDSLHSYGPACFFR